MEKKDLKILIAIAEFKQELKGFHQKGFQLSTLFEKSTDKLGWQSDVLEPLEKILINLVEIQEEKEDNHDRGTTRS